MRSRFLGKGRCLLCPCLLAFLVFGACGCAAAAPAGSWKVIRLPPHGLRRMLRARGGLVIPDLWVFNSRGRLIFRFAGNHRDLIPSLVRTLAHPVPIKGPSLSDWLTSRQIADLLKSESSKGLIFIESWASWNPACQSELNDLEHYLDAHPKLSVRGVLLSVDSVRMSSRPHR